MLFASWQFVILVATSLQVFGSSVISVACGSSRTRRFREGGRHAGQGGWLRPVGLLSLYRTLLSALFPRVNVVEAFGTASMTAGWLGPWASAASGAGSRNPAVSAAVPRYSRKNHILPVAIYRLLGWVPVIKRHPPTALVEFAYAMMIVAVIFNSGNAVPCTYLQFGEAGDTLAESVFSAQEAYR
jgi:hypothetical protein